MRSLQSHPSVYPCVADDPSVAQGWFYPRGEAAIVWFNLPQDVPVSGAPLTLYAEIDGEVHAVYSCVEKVVFDLESGTVYADLVTFDKPADGDTRAA